MTKIIIDSTIQIIRLPNGDLQLKCKSDQAPLSPTPKPPIPTPPTPPVNIMGTIDVSNFSSESADSIKKWVDAVQIQCDRDCADKWGTVAFNIIPKGGTPVKGHWQAGFFDNTDQ